MRLPAIIVALSALLAAGSVHAQPAMDGFEVFKSACAAHKADSAMAIAEVDAKGWKPVPAAMLATMSPIFKDALNLQGRILLTSASNGITLVTGDDFKIPGANGGSGGSDHTRMCTVIVGSAPDPSIKSAVAMWMGGAAALADDKESMYAFIETDSVRRFLTRADGDDKAAEQLFKDGKMSIVLVGTQPQVTIFSYITPNRAN
jgi:hypothetical protein